MELGRTEMTTEDNIQDYVEYLVDLKGVRGLQDLLPEEHSKLLFLLLVNDNLYVKLIKSMHKILTLEAQKQTITRR
jgi:hypothetical protein